MAEWFRLEFAMGTMANRLSVRRWRAEKTDKPNVVHPENAFYEIVNESPVKGEDRSQPLDTEKLAQIRDDHNEDVAATAGRVRPAARGESIKFQPRYTNRGGRTALKAS